MVALLTSNRTPHERERDPTAVALAHGDHVLTVTSTVLVSTARAAARGESNRDSRSATNRSARTVAKPVIRGRDVRRLLDRGWFGAEQHCGPAISLCRERVARIRPSKCQLGLRGGNRPLTTASATTVATPREAILLGRPPARSRLAGNPLSTVSVAAWTSTSRGGSSPTRVDPARVASSYGSQVASTLVRIPGRPSRSRTIEASRRSNWSPAWESCSPSRATFPTVASAKQRRERAVGSPFKAGPLRSMKRHLVAFGDRRWSQRVVHRRRGRREQPGVFGGRVPRPSVIVAPLCIVPVPATSVAIAPPTSKRKTVASTTVLIALTSTPSHGAFPLGSAMDRSERRVVCAHCPRSRALRGPNAIAGRP